MPACSPIGEGVMTTSVNARLRQLKRIVDCDPRVVSARDSIGALTRVIIDFQERQADSYFVIEQLRGLVAEHKQEIAGVADRIRRTGR